MGTYSVPNCNNLIDSNATFSTTGSGLAGCWVEIIAGTGSGQRRRITSNTATKLTLASDWTTANPSTDSVYHIGNIDFYVTSAEFDATDFFGANAAGRTLNFNQPLIIECDEQTPSYTTGRASLTNGSATMTGVADADGNAPTWVTNSIARGQNIYITGYHEYEHFVSAVGAETTITMTAAWAGKTGVYDYAIGAVLLKVDFYVDGESTAYKTVYVNTASSPVYVPIRCKCKSLKYKISNNRVDESVKITSITLKQPQIHA